ncbi:MAG TPA: M1 family aminopeptidase [Terriglobales bacterium]|nr:M1 family aminopeptidase [Terriglobales bacterium]
MRVLASLLLAGATLLAQTACAGEQTPREQLKLFDALQLDPAASYEVTPQNRIELRRADVLLSFDEGTLAFFAASDGQVTGAVFSGRGHVLAAPRDPAEKQQMALFLGAPVLDEDFSSSYMRFSDGTAAELLAELHKAKVSPKDGTLFEKEWEPVLTRLNPRQSLRLLSERLTLHPRPYFYALLSGAATGPFDFVFDQSRDEPILFGQFHKGDSATYYDVWASYRVPGIDPLPRAFHAESYSIDTTIHPDNSIDGSALIRIKVDTAGERLIALQLARDLDIVSATLADGTPLVCFHNEGMGARERVSHGDDSLYVVLPQVPRSGDVLNLNFSYKGKVIRDAGNGVLFVSDRESWYPHLGDAGSFADYALTIRWPRKLRLAATGVKIDEQLDGDYRVGHWRTEKPASVAGFNLGEYAFASLPSDGYSVDVYANRFLEQALVNRLRPPAFDMSTGLPPASGRASRGEMLAMQMPDPSPADALKQLGKEISSSIQFFQTYCGPFPYPQLSVSQIPGTFGQGWPGLLYLSTYSFLPAQAQARAGLSTSAQEHFNDLVPFHEVAHQWWGNVVGWSSYRDQWIDEALANYLALLYADAQKNSEPKLRVWLDRYRANLTAKPEGGDMPIADYGSLTLGSRLISSKTPNGFDQLVYGKGSWVIHMLREMLRQPGAKNPDERFVGLLHTLITKYSYRALSTEDFQREVEAAMTPSMDIEDSHSMDWFFDEWVRGTGIPHYHLEYTTHRIEKGFLVKGTLYQTEVPRWFVSPVPLYSSSGEYLGRVIAGGPETSFHFIAHRAPGKIEIDPHGALLCVVEREKLSAETLDNAVPHSGRR